MLHISDELVLPLDIITMRMALYGDSGAGKTTFARLLAEKAHESKHRFCAVDLKNDWWGLKSSADGAAAGIPVVVFGGPRADVKLFEDAAAASTLAETVTSIDQSVVIDLDAQSRRQQEKFLAVFLDRLYETNRNPLLVFCDEADRYAPQKPMTPEAINSLSSSEDIARRGRKRGIGSVWLTQRTAVLAKNVSEFANLVVVFRTPGSRDLKELEERVGRIADKEIVSQVVRLAPGLQDGEAFFLSAHPKLRGHLPRPVRPIQLPLPWTFDSSATPAVGQRRREPKVLAQADLAAIEQKMAKQVERAKAEDPGHLRRRVADLEKQLSQRPKEQIERVVEKIVEVPVLKNGALTRTEKIADRLQAFADRFTAETMELRKLIAPAAAPRPAPEPLRPVQARPVVPRPVAPRRETTVAVQETGTMNRGERAVLTACAQYPDGVSREQLTILTGYKRSSRDTYLQRLRAWGYVGQVGDSIVATDAGIKALGDFDPLPTGSALRNYWLNRLGGGERAILEVLIAHYPDAVRREDIDAGYQRSSRDTYLQRLSARKLVENLGRGEVKASGELFD